MTARIPTMMMPGMSFDYWAACLPELHASVQLLDAVPGGYDLARDMFALYYQWRPEPVADAPDERRANAAIRDATLGSASYRALHGKTAGNHYLSALAVVAGAPGWLAILTGDPAALFLAHLGQVRDSTSGEFVAGGSDPLAQARLGRWARAAIALGHAVVHAEIDATEVWAPDSGALICMEPDDRLRISLLLRSERMTAIGRMLGRARELAAGAQASKWVPGTDEVHTVTRGDDLARVIPSELAGLGLPGFTEDFYRRFAERDLAMYQPRSLPKVGRGPVIVARDGSSSMHEHGRDHWAVALDLQLAAVANEDMRAHHGIVFGGRGVWTEQTVAPGDLDSMLRYAAFTIKHGGTDFEGPLRRAVDLIADSPAWATADIVLITDGFAEVTDDWVAWFAGSKARLGFRLWVVTIAARTNRTVRSIADYTADLTDIMGADADAAVTSIFNRINRR